MLSVSTVVFDGQDMAAGFDLVAKLGLRAVEPAFIKGYVAFDETTFLPASAARMAEMLAQSGLRAAALSAHLDLGEPDSIERLLHRADYAARIGAPTVVTNATTLDRRGALEALLAVCLPEFAARKVVLALENPGHGTDALIPDGAAGAALVKEFADPWLRLNYDIGNALTYGARSLSAGHDLACALPHAARLHLKDVATVGADWRFCAIGDGAVGYSGLLDWLFQQPGLPSLGLELPLRLTRPGRGDPVRGADPVSLTEARKAIAASVAFCEALRARSVGTASD